MRGAFRTFSSRDSSGAGAHSEPLTHSRLTAIGRSTWIEAVPFARQGRLAGLPRNTCCARTCEAAEPVF